MKSNLYFFSRKVISLQYFVTNYTQRSSRIISTSISFTQLDKNTMLMNIQDVSVPQNPALEVDSRVFSPANAFSGCTFVSGSRLMRDLFNGVCRCGLFISADLKANGRKHTKQRVPFKK